MEIKFKPHIRKDCQYAIAIYKNNFIIGFVHWIDSLDGQICRVNNPDMVMSPVRTEELCQAHCNWLEDEYQKGVIK